MALLCQYLLLQLAWRIVKGPQYARSITVPLLRATSDTVPIVHAALTGLLRIYRPGYLFIKAGVMLLDLHSAKLRQGKLDLEPQVGEPLKTPTPRPKPPQPTRQSPHEQAPNPQRHQV